AFIARLARRLLPPAALVLAGVLAGTLLFLPRTRWSDTLSEVLASAFYYENWQLATSAVDYLANDAAASPVQHFWSLGIQGQFYLIWPLLLALSTVLATRTRRRPEAVFLAVNGVVFAVSLTYSVLRTAENQPWAYFDTGARLWELALGGILAIVLPRLRVPHAVRVALGWIGLVALVACGLVLQVSTVFPGYAALWPTGAAVMIIIAGVTGGRFAADRLLTLRPLAYVGGVSYPLTRRPPSLRPPPRPRRRRRVRALPVPLADPGFLSRGHRARRREHQGRAVRPRRVVRARRRHHPRHRRFHERGAPGPPRRGPLHRGRAGLPAARGGGHHRLVGVPGRAGAAAGGAG